jgi:hypothetical protein
VKVLLDEMLPVGVARLLPGHDVTTVQQAGFKGLANGILLQHAVSGGYDVLLTADRSLPAQQNIVSSGIAIVLVRGSRMADIAVQAEAILAAVAAAEPGPIIRVEP